MSIKLLESERRSQKSFGHTAISAALHAVAITLAVYATANAGGVIKATVEIPTPIYPPQPAKPARTHPPVSHPRTPQTPAAPRGPRESESLIPSDARELARRRDRARTIRRRHARPRRHAHVRGARVDGRSLFCIPARSAAAVALLPGRGWWPQGEADRAATSEIRWPRIVETGWNPSISTARTRANN
jgi:hypothetical protein